MRLARASCDAARARVEREVEVERMGVIAHLASDRACVPRELESSFAVRVKRVERVHEAGEEVRKGYAATRASWREEVGIYGVDGGWRGGGKRSKDVGVFSGVGCYQHWCDPDKVNG